MIRPPDDAALSRRSFLTVASALTLVAACGNDGSPSRSDATTLTATDPATSVRGAAASPATSSAAGSTGFVTSGPATHPRVALTFHTDGDLDLAQQVLAALADTDAPMTAFVVGEWLEANPSWGPRLVDAGHELANHTYTHPDFDSLGPQAMRDEIARCRDVLVRTTGQAGAFFRPSGTADGTMTPPDAVLAAAHEAGYPVVVGFDVDPFDYEDPGATAVVERTLGTAARAGSIVSLHFGHPGTVAALPAILDGLAAASLTPVTVSGLLAPDRP